MSYTLGIDLGTTNCSVTAIDNQGKTTVIRNKDGEFLTPSAVYFNPEPNSVIVGKRAKQMSREDPANLVMFVKREMGKSKDEVRFDKLERKSEPYLFWGRMLSPEEISAFILRQLKEDAETFLKTRIEDAVITCPAYFGSREKEATRLAGELAGLKVLEIIPEPTAAALSYGAVTDQSQENIFVFDLGGGTFDVTVLNVVDGVNGKNISMVATDGNRKLGGKDWDDYLISHMVERFNEKFGIDIEYGNKKERDLVFGRLRLDVEKAKIQLSSTPSVTLGIEFGGESMQETFTMEKFQSITDSLVEECKVYCDNTLKDSNLTWSKIHTIVMVGSMSNSPPVQKALESWSGKKIQFGIVNPKTCVSEGAAILGYKLKGGGQVQTLIDAPAYDSDASDKNAFEAMEKLQETGPRRAIVIEHASNVVPSSFGIKARKPTGEYIIDPIIKKNTQYPVSIKKRYPLSSDGMETLDITVYEGESRNPDECDFLGIVSLGLKGSLSKDDLVEVSLSIDTNGILQVSALDLRNGIKVEATIKRQGALSVDEIEESKNNIEMLSLG